MTGDMGPAISADGSGAEVTPAVMSCPAVPPAAGSACTATAAPCSWGDHPLTACRTFGRCGDARWIITAPPAFCAMNPPACPVARPSGVCPAGDPPWCVYESRYLCSCTGCCDAPGCTARCNGQPQNTKTWACTGAPTLVAPCPAIIPNRGAPCSVPADAECPYNSCGLEVRCQGGVWTWFYNNYCPVM